MKYRGARIQVLDLPGIIEGAADGRGRGRQVISTARTCNLILIVLDAGKPVTHKKIIEQELFSFGIRINQVPPDVKIVVKTNGGIGYQEVAKQTKGMNPEVARLVCKEYKISCAEIILREDITVDQFIDVIEGKYVLIKTSQVCKKRRAWCCVTAALLACFLPHILFSRAYIPVLYVFNKIDSITIEELDILDQLPNYVPISSQHEWNLEELMEEIWNRCNMLRIYTKPKGLMPDYGTSCRKRFEECKSLRGEGNQNVSHVLCQYLFPLVATCLLLSLQNHTDEPVILHAENPTIEEFCNRLHRNLINDFSFAWVWGSSAKHQPQRCGKDHVLCDEDIVQIVKKV